MLSANKVSLILALCLSLALLPLSHSQAADPMPGDTVLDRAALTRATLELQRDLLLAKEKYRDEERRGLALYLDIDKLARGKIESIRITLDKNTIIQQDLDAREMEMLAAGAMKRLGVIPLPRGIHVLQTTVTGGGRHVTKTVELDKSDGRDHLKITITRLLQQRTPEITYTHETWAAIK